MRVMEKITRIVHTILCVLNIGCIFFGLMLLSGGGNTAYRIFRAISLLFSIPMFFMRLAYLQYILFGIIGILAVIIYINKIKNEEVEKKQLWIDGSLWLITIIELVFLENYFLNIIHF